MYGDSTSVDLGTTQLFSVSYDLYAKATDLSNACNRLNFYYCDKDNNSYGNHYVVVFSYLPPEHFVSNKIIVTT